MEARIYNDDCLKRLDKIKANSIDCIITDPPYELHFMGKAWDNSGISFQKETWAKCLRVLKPGGYLLAFGGSRTYHRIACAIEDAGFEIRDTIMWLYGSGFPKSMNLAKGIEAKEQYGKTNTVAKRQVEQSGGGKEYQVGGLNIDECRIETGEIIAKNVRFRQEKQSDGWGTKRCITEPSTQGRFPANTILDGQADGEEWRRYFYCAKASKKDRDEGLEAFAIKTSGELTSRHEGSAGITAFTSSRAPKRNNHPTVKPTLLMQYLIRLVAPNGATILDPFMGSGSTGKAVMYENKERGANYKFIGIEKNSEYCEIAEARIKYVDCS